MLSTIENDPSVLDEPADSDSERAVPSPGKPSLILRLFKADSTKKEMLKAMFDTKKQKQQ